MHRHPSIAVTIIDIAAPTSSVAVPAIARAIVRALRAGWATPRTTRPPPPASPRSFPPVFFSPAA